MPKPSDFSRDDYWEAGITEEREHVVAFLRAEAAHRREERPTSFAAWLYDDAANRIEREAHRLAANQS